MDLGFIILCLGGGGGERDGDFDSCFIRLLDEGLSGDPDSDLCLHFILSLETCGGSGDDSLLERAFLVLLGGDDSGTERLNTLGEFLSGELLQFQKPCMLAKSKYTHSLSLDINTQILIFKIFFFFFFGIVLQNILPVAHYSFPCLSSIF